MKFNGKPLSTRNRQSVSFMRGDERITLIVSSVPSSFFNHMLEKGAYEFATVPEKPIWKSKNIPLTDENGNVKYKKDFDDPDYQAKRRKNNERYAALRIMYGLRHDPNVAWESVKPDDTAPKADWAAYADSLVAELEDADGGFEDGEIALISKAIDTCDLVEAKEASEEEAIKTF